MSELFEIYQDNIKNVFTKITKILNDINTVNPDKAEGMISDAENNIRDAEKLVRALLIK
jgi:hypothetical protein